MMLLALETKVSSRNAKSVPSVKAPAAPAVDETTVKSIGPPKAVGSVRNTSRAPG
jgi:hypothetical protein